MVDPSGKKNLRCPKCGRTEGQMKTGFNRSGSQRCICKYCDCKYTLNPKYPEDLKQEAIRLYKTGLSGREVGRILNINKASVLNWIRKYENDTEKK